MSRRKSLALQRIEYALYRTIARFARRLSDESVIRWGDRFGNIARRILRSRDRLAMRNLRETFPGRNDLRDVLDRCWRHFGREALYSIRMQDMSLEANLHGHAVKRRPQCTLVTARTAITRIPAVECHRQPHDPILGRKRPLNAARPEQIVLLASQTRGRPHATADPILDSRRIHQTTNVTEPAPPNPGPGGRPM